MSFVLPHTPAAVLRDRREKLATSLGGATAFVFAGGERPRNYPANTYPYRADSHFLYLADLSLPRAVLAVGPDGSTLFRAPHGPQDALWHGPVPGDDELLGASGIDRVRDLADLPDAIASAIGACTLPSADPSTRVAQARMLGRGWTPGAHPAVGELDAPDLALADALIDLRLRHDAAALAGIRGAVEVTVAAHRAGMIATAPGRHEREVRAAIEAEMIAAEAVPAYGSIVTVAGEILHNVTHHRRLEAGDLMLVDAGAELHGWASDVTRTWPVSGSFSPTQRALYDVVLAAQQAAIEAIRPGVRYRDLHLLASTVLARGLVDEGILRGDPEGLVERGAHALFFPHGLGHLMGLDVHDMEDLWDRAGYAPGRTRAEDFGLCYLRLDRDLEPGMVVTIEPGLYVVPAILATRELVEPFERDGTLCREALERFADVRGIRIEDDVLCTDDGAQVLTAEIPKAPDEVVAAVGG